MTIGTKTGADEVAGKDSSRADWDARASRLYEDFRRPAMGMVRRAFGSAFSDSEIEDFYASAWLGTLRALAKRHSNLSDDEVRSYLLTAVANHASKEIRRRKRKPVAPLDDAARVIPDPTGTPEESFSSRETSQIARDVLSSLPPRRRAVMLLRYGLDLEPMEICGLVEGLSHRAYRKEISRGVDEMTTKLRKVEAGNWCEDREPVLKAYAAGIADGDQVQQAEKHMAHCKQCSEFVGRLGGHLHDLGSAVAVPGALDSLDGRISLHERVGELVDRVRGASPSGPDPDLVSAATSVRGTGAVGGGLAAKFAAMGGAGKIAAACLGGGLAATACVAAGVAPLSVRSEAPAKAAEVVRDKPKLDRPKPKRPPVIVSAPTAPSVEAGPHPQAQAEGPSNHVTQPAEAKAEPAAPVVQPPPVAAETGLAPAASVGAAPSSASGSGPSKEQQAVRQEFGP